MLIGLATVVIFAPITFLALIRKNVREYRKLALASILSGFIVNIGFFIAGILVPEKIEIKASFIPAFIVAALVLLLGVIGKRNWALFSALPTKPTIPVFLTGFLLPSLDLAKRQNDWLRSSE